MSYTLYEADRKNPFQSIKKQVPDDPKVHALIGQGVGNQYHTISDFSYKGLWIQDIYEIDGGFKDDNGILKTYTQDEYDNRGNDYQWEISTYADLCPMPGSIIELHPAHEPSEILHVVDLEIGSDKRKTITMGAKNPNFVDAYDVITGQDRQESDNYLTELNASLTETVEFTPPATGTLTFAVPNLVKEDQDLPRITIEISLSVTDTTGDHTVSRISPSITVGGTAARFGQYPPTTINGDSLPETDITDLITVNTNNAIVITLLSDDPIPKTTASGTMNFYRRTPLL